MITLSTLLIFIGFWGCYQTSRRVEPNASNQLETWIRNNRPKGKFIGMTGLIAGLVLSMVTFGVGSGIFSFFMILTTLASLIILLSPLGYMNFRNIGAVAVASFILESAI